MTPSQSHIACTSVSRRPEVLHRLEHGLPHATIEHVVSKKNTTKSLDRLSGPEQLNYHAHWAFTAKLDQFINAPASFDSPGHFPHQVVSVCHGKTRITGPLRLRLKSICYTPKLEEYWKEKFGWTRQDLKCIHREAFSEVMKKFQLPDQRRIQQFRCNFVPINARCSHWIDDRESFCMSCP